jgi:uncharacterized protein (DUF2384 family)
MGNSGRVVAAVAIRRIAENWELTEDETARLLGSDVSTMRELFHTRGGEALSDEILKRIGTVIAIWENVVSLFGTGQIGQGWMTRPNADFGNVAPIRRMTSGSLADLAEIREYLDSARRTP